LRGFLVLEARESTNEVPKCADFARDAAQFCVVSALLRQQRVSFAVPDAKGVGVRMSIVIDRRERDALWGGALAQLELCAHLPSLVQRGDVEAAAEVVTRQREAMELLDALGWDRRSAAEEVVVGLAPWRLVAVLARLFGSAALAIAADENEGLRDAHDRETLRRRLAVVTCARVLGDLAREQQSVAGGGS
jgi:hypothetical protein